LDRGEGKRSGAVMTLCSTCFSAYLIFFVFIIVLRSQSHPSLTLVETKLCFGKRDILLRSYSLAPNLTCTRNMNAVLPLVRNYGDLLLQVAANCPDGIVCFFTSYQYMEYVVTKWDEMGILQALVQSKLLYLETKDIVETTMALDNYKRACDCGRGAIF